MRCLLLILAVGSAQDFNSDLFVSPAARETPSKGGFIIYNRGKGDPPKKGQYLKRHEPGEVAEFHVFAPEGLDPGKKYPLVIVYHGGLDGGSGRGLCRSYSKLSTKENPVFVLSPNMYTMDAYNELLAEKKHAIDTSRVVVLGFSSGGYGVGAALREFARTSGAFTPAMLICASTAATAREYPPVPYVVIAGEHETPEHVKNPILKKRRSACRSHSLDMHRAYREVRYVEMKGIGHSVTRPEHHAVVLNLLRGLPERTFEFSVRRPHRDVEALLQHANDENWKGMHQEIERLGDKQKTVRRKLMKEFEKWFDGRVRGLRKLSAGSPTFELTRALAVYDRLKEVTALFPNLEKPLRSLEKSKHWRDELEARRRYHDIVSERSDLKSRLEKLRSEMPDTEFGGRRTRETLLALGG